MVTMRSHLYKRYLHFLDSDFSFLQPSAYAPHTIDTYCYRSTLQLAKKYDSLDISETQTTPCLAYLKGAETVSQMPAACGFK
jgi:hypothetical protein